MSNELEYKPLDRAHNEVRLLTIIPNELPNSSPVQCWLKSVTLDDQPEYVALSYTWGDANLTEEIKVDGVSFQATKSLESALRRLRDTKHDIHMWVDAVCIDQRNLLERGQQVQLMQRIYGQAKEVLIWLGDEDDESDSAIDLMEALADVQTDCLTRTNGNYDVRGPRYDAMAWGSPHSWNVSDELVALERLFARSWWHRIWVIQEVAMSKKATVHCGSRSIEWQQVVKSVDLLIAHVQDVVSIVKHQSSDFVHRIPGLFRVGGIDAVRVISTLR